MVKDGEDYDGMRMVRIVRMMGMMRMVRILRMMSDAMWEVRIIKMMGCCQVMETMQITYGNNARQAQDFSHDERGPAEERDM